MTLPRLRFDAGRCRRRRAFAADVVASVAEVFSIPAPVLYGKARPHEVAQARHAAYLLCYGLTTLSFPAIGRLLGWRDHSTVIHGVDRCIYTMRRDPAYRASVVQAARRAIASNPLEAADAALIAGQGAALAQEPVGPVEPPAPAPVEPPAPAPEPAPWWELSDDELISAAIAGHRARGGDFVEVWP